MSVNGAKMPRLGSARLGSARLGSARLGSARLGSAEVLHLLFSVSSSNSIKSSGKIRKLGVLCPVSGFFFCRKGAHCRNFTPKCQVLRMFESILSVHLLRQQFLMI